MSIIVQVGGLLKNVGHPDGQCPFFERLYFSVFARKIRGRVSRRTAAAWG